MSKNIEMIAAMSRNRVIGRKNSMPWHIPEDLKHFKSITLNHRVIMGRKTYQSIGKPLVNRENIVLSRNEKFKNNNNDNIKIYSSLDRVLIESKKIKTFIIGGETLYKQFLQFSSKLHITLIDKEISGDRYFPNFNEDIWDLVYKSTKNSYGNYSYFFLTYKRKEDI